MIQATLKYNRIWDATFLTYKKGATIISYVYSFMKGEVVLRELKKEGWQTYKPTQRNLTTTVYFIQKEDTNE